MMNDVSILMGLSDPSFRERHWKMLEESTGVKSPYQSENATFDDLINAGILSVQEQVEEVCD